MTVNRLAFLISSWGRTTTVSLGIVIVGLLVHGMQASELGLYWDDAKHFVRGMPAADSPLGFIVSDTTGTVNTQEPFGTLTCRSKG